MRFFLSVFSFCLVITTASAQKIADFVKVDSGKTVYDAFYFYLPRTAIEFEFTIAETLYTKGELSGFANQYFQSQPETMNNRSKYSIENISMKPYPVADPSQKYRYSAQTASTVNIQTLNGGIIKSINSMVDVKSDFNQSGIVSKFSKNDESADASVPFFSLGVKSDTIIKREITADSTIIESRVINRRTVTNTPEEMARESIQKLDDISKIRYTLISGPEDVVIDGASLATSLKELEKTEQELLALFFGKSKKITQTYRITYIPGESPEFLFYLHPEKGVSMASDNSSEGVKVNVKSFNGLISADSNSSIATSGVIPYRSSEKMVLSILWNGSKYFETELMLPQFGKIHAVPMKSLTDIRVIYDEQSGAIESIGPVGKK